MKEVFEIAGIILLSAIVTPFVIYFSVLGGTTAFLSAKKVFEHHNNLRRLKDENEEATRTD